MHFFEDMSSSAPPAQRLRALLRWLAGTVVALLLMVGALLALLQVDAITTRTAAWAIARALPSGASISLTRASGSVVRTLRLDSLRIHDSDGSVVLHVSRVELRFQLTRLLKRDVHITDAVLEGLRATIARRNDSTWALFPRIPAEPVLPDTDSSRWRIRVDKLSLVDGALAAVELNGERHRVDDLALLAQDLRVGDDFRGTLDSLSGRLALAGHENQSGLVRARLAWNKTRVSVDTLLLLTTGSRLSAQGVLPLAGDDVISSETRFVASLHPVTLDELTPFIPVIGGGAFSANLEAVGDSSGALHFTLAVVAPDSGRVHLRGRTRFGSAADSSAADTRLAVEGEISAFNLASVLATSRVSGVLTGTVRGDLAGPDFQHLTGDVDVTVARSVIRERVVDGGSATAQLANGRVHLRAALEIDSLRVIANGEIDPTAKPLTFSLRAEVGGAALSAALGAAPGTGSALIIASGRGVPGKGTIALEAELDSAALVATPLATLRAEGEMRGDSIALWVTATLLDSGGAVQSRVMAHPFATPLRATLHNGQLNAINLRALTAASPATRLNARFAGELRGIAPDSMRAQLDLTVDSSMIGTRALHAGTVALRLASGELDLTSRLVFEDGHADVRAVAQPFSATRRINASAAVTLGEGRLDASGWAAIGADLATAAGSFTLNARALGWRSLIADSAHAELHLADGTARLDTLWLRSSMGIIDGGGTVPLIAEAAPAALHVIAEVSNLDALRASLDAQPLAAGAATASFDITGPSDSLRIDAEAHVEALSVGEMRLFGFDAVVSALASVDSGLHRAEASLDFQRLKLARAEIAQTVLELRYDPAEDLLVKVNTRVDDGRSIELSARFDAAGPSPAWTLDQAELSIGGEQWSLAGPARLQSTAGFSLQQIVLDGPGKGISIRGALDSAGIDDFHIVVDSFPIEAVADLLGYERLGGRVSATLDIAGKSAARVIEGSLRFAVNDEARPVGLVVLNGSLRDSTLALQGSIEQDARESATIEGTVPLGEGSPRAIDLRIALDKLDATLFGPFVEREVARGIRGAASGTMTVAGPRGALQLDGTVDISGGRVELPPLGVTWSDVSLAAQLAGDKVRIERAQLSSGGGTLRAEGALTLNGFTADSIALDLDVFASRFRAINTERYHAVIGGDIDVLGTLAAPELRGKVTVLRGDVHLGTGVAGGSQEEIVLTDADYAEVEKYFGFPIRASDKSPGSAFDSLTIDLNVDVGRDTWLRQDANPRIAIQVTGSMRIQKHPGPDIDLLGELETIDSRSYVEQFGRRFELRGGRVDFQGGPLDTRFSLKSAYTVPSRTDNEPEAVILLGIEGKAGDLQVTVSSEPSMSNEDIVSYLATGRPAGQALALGDDGGLLSAGTGLALGRVAGLIEGYAGEQIGLDVIEIRRDGVRGSTLIAGRYVSPRLYLGFKQPLSQPQGVTEATQTRVEIEFQAYRWLLLNFESGGEALQFFLKARYGY